MKCEINLVHFYKIKIFIFYNNILNVFIDCNQELPSMLYMLRIAHTM